MENNILARTLVTGCDGALGSYIDFGIRTDRSMLDITDLAQVRKVLHEHKPAVVLHLAAATDMTKCEEDPSFAYFVNAVGTYNLALACKEIGARLVYLSTAGVFGGKKTGLYKEDDIPDPPNVYGSSKYFGELAVQSVLDDYLIVRTCWVFGGGPTKDKKFVGKIMTQLKNPSVKELKGTSDEMGSPTYGKDLAAALAGLIQKGEKGVVHVANSGVASRYDVLKAIALEAGIEVAISPVPLSTFDPKFGITMNQGLSSRIGLLRPWADALKEYIAEEWR